MTFVRKGVRDCVTGNSQSVPRFVLERITNLVSRHPPIRPNRFPPLQEG